MRYLINVRTLYGNEKGLIFLKKLIKNCMIVTMDKKSGVINNGYILIEGNRITEVGSGDFKKQDEDIEIIDGTGYCAMPGLINCHTHAAMTPS
jgi:5-methylthioadenosine/S-adenosylhomocysteine deaminase